MIFAFLKRVILPSAVILLAKANSDMCPQAHESDATYYLKMLRLGDMQVVWLDLLTQKPREMCVNGAIARFFCSLVW